MSKEVPVPEVPLVMPKQGGDDAVHCTALHQDVLGKVLTEVSLPMLLPYTEAEALLEMRLRVYIPGISSLPLFS